MLFLRRHRAVSVSLCLMVGWFGCGGGNSSGVGNGGNGPPASTITSVDVSCSPSSVQVNQTSKCSATVIGTGSFSSAVTWSADNGSIDQSGNYTAPGNIAMATVKATSIQDSTKSGTATITVNAVPPTITSVSVSCSPSSIPVNQSATCTSVVSGTGNFSSSVIWSVDNGSIDQSGSYSAPTTPTTATVKATSVQDSTKSGTAKVGVIAGISLVSLTFEPDAVVSGNTSTATVVSSISAPAGGVQVLLSSSNQAAALLPASVTIAGGNTTATFNVTAESVTSPASVTITATSATIQAGALIVDPAATVNWSGGPQPVGQVFNQCVAGDFNGDGKTDLACYFGNPFGSENWSVSLSTGTGWQLQSWNTGPAPVSNRPWSCYTGDLNKDGKSDIACYTFDGTGAWNVGLSTGSGWDSEVWSGGPNPSSFPSVRFRNCFTGDFNGDAATDLACASTTAGTWELGLSTGSGWNDQLWSGGPGIALPANNQCFSGDFNGDGKADLACYAGVGTGWGVGLSTGSSPWQSALWNGGPAPAEPVFGQCFTGDLNGDGKTDLACYTGSAGVWAVALSSGSGW